MVEQPPAGFDGTETPEPVFLSKNRAAEFKKWITG